MTKLRARIESARDRFRYIDYAFDIILFCPCVCIEGLRFCFKPNYRGSDERPESEQPIPLEPRARALTLPLDDVAPGQRTVEQPQSAFFAKLPLELRHRVYQYTLGGAIIHLRVTARKLRGARSLPPTRRDPASTNAENDLKCALGLLRTCRIVYVLVPSQGTTTTDNCITSSYSESVEFLYSANYMIMSNVQPEPFVLPHLPKLIVPQRLNSIRHLRINWSVNKYIRRHDSDLTEWDAGWESLSRLEGLHHLHIRIRNPDLPSGPSASDFFPDVRNMWDEFSPYMFKHVERVKVLKKFVITLPHADCSADFDVGTSNCVFRLPVR